METGILVAVLVIGVLIAFHELGHFIFAKLFGVGVKRFSIGFGPVILSKRFGETEYALSLIPLGGYVAMVDENEEEKEPVDPQKSFAKKSVWKRLIICLAGPGFNVLLALILIISGNIIYGIPTLTTKIGEVVKGSPAMEAGLRAGDKIIGIETMPSKSGDGFIPVGTWEQVIGFMKENDGKELKLLVLPKGMPPATEIRVKPKLGEIKNLFGETIKGYFIGIQSADPVYVKNVPQSFSSGIKATVNITSLTAVGLWKMVSGKLAPSESVGGPIMIVQIGSGMMASGGLKGILFFASVISINLAILNLLPIPVLDGGHIPFLLIEAVRGKPVSKKVRERAFTVGLVLLLLLMVFATSNDISRLYKK